MFKVELLNNRHVVIR